MDPLQNVRMALSERPTDPRRVSVGPPPMRPSSRPEPSAGQLDDHSAGAGESQRAASMNAVESVSDVAPGPDGVASSDGTSSDLPGAIRGRQRLLQVNLPEPTRGLLDRARTQANQPRGVVAMAAIRATYASMAAERLEQEPVETSPFGAPYRSRQRRGLEEAKNVQLYVAIHEAAGVAQACAVLGLSVSALFTEAIDRHYGAEVRRSDGLRSELGG
jgi:hypothetical protein